MHRLLTAFRLLLYPVALLYGTVTWIRNKLYDRGILKSVTFDLPLISVGNLSTGGTGKTPHIEYLVRLLQQDFRLATLSRGYKRQTRGFLKAGANSTAADIGDEPMQFHRKFPELTVSVCEDRLTGIPRLLYEQPETEIVLLDDAFQHRTVTPGLNILVTEFSRPFYRDHLLPAGNLRESRKGYRRADIIIVSKCPPMEAAVKAGIIRKINPRPHQSVYFASLAYGPITDFFSGKAIEPIPETCILVVCGIARPEPMLLYLQENFSEARLIQYADHHFYKPQDLEAIYRTFKEWNADHKIIVTTEKDAARLDLHRDTISSWNIPVGVLPVAVSFPEQEAHFAGRIRRYLKEELGKSEASE